MKAASDSFGPQLQDALGGLGDSVTGFDPNASWFGWASTWGNQFISSGFPINLLGVWAQLATAQGVASVGGDIGSGLSEAWD